MAATLLEQIDDQLQLIQAKLALNTGVTDISALVATLTTNVATTDGLLDALVLATGNGLGIIADVPEAADLHTWIAAAIVTET